MKNVIIQESAYNGDVNVTKKNNRTVEFIACVQTADEPNRNGRIYPKRVLEKALESPYIKERLATRTLYVECGHPMDTSVQRQMTIDLRNVAAIIEEFWWEGNNLKARITTADTAVGRDMMGLIEQGSRIAFSLRAQGSVHTNPTTGLVEVEDGLQICTYDWVCNPSHAKAFLEKICEATAISMYGANRKNLNTAVLTESANIFENGNIIDENSTGDAMETIDYTKKYNTKFKYLSEMYLPATGDEVLSMDDHTTVVKSGNFKKYVMTEDYMVKNIRKSIISLAEIATTPEYSEERGDSATVDKKPEEASADIDNSDVYPEDEHKEAEEVGDVMIKEYVDLTEDMTSTIPENANNDDLAKWLEDNKFIVSDRNVEVLKEWIFHRIGNQFRKLGANLTARNEYMHNPELNSKTNPNARYKTAGAYSAAMQNAAVRDANVAYTANKQMNRNDRQYKRDAKRLERYKLRHDISIDTYNKLQQGLRNRQITANTAIANKAFAHTNVDTQPMTQSTSQPQPQPSNSQNTQPPSNPPHEPPAPPAYTNITGAYSGVASSPATNYTYYTPFSGAATQSGGQPQNKAPKSNKKSSPKKSQNRKKGAATQSGGQPQNKIPKNSDKKDTITESLSVNSTDIQLCEWLYSNGFEISEANVSALRESLQNN